MTTRALIKITSKEQWLKERAKDLTSTDISVLFGLSPYKTAFELYHEKKDGTVFEITETERMTWGNRLEEAIGRGICEDNNWQGAPFKDYVRDMDNRLGSSFDWVVKTPEDAILEIKNVDVFAAKNTWAIDGSKIIEAPPHIELQVQHQLLVSGHKTAYIGALVGGNSVSLLKRSADKSIQEMIVNKTKEFWAMVDSGNPPKPDFEKDAQAIARLYSYSSPGKAIEASPEIMDLAVQYRDLSEQEKSIKEKKDAVKAQILMIADDAEKIKGEGFTVSMGMVGPTEVSFTRKGFRNFRISWRKK